MEIVLSRHGEPDVSLWAWMSPREIRGWIEVYDKATVLIEQVTSAAKGKAAAAGVIVCSPLPRSIESAQVLCANGRFVVEEIFREADLPYGQWPFPRLPLIAWVQLLRLKWLAGYWANLESMVLAKERARCAAQRLVDLAQEHGSAYLVGHGILNVMIAQELLALGWSGPKRPASWYWQFSVYRASA